MVLKPVVEGKALSYGLYDLNAALVMPVREKFNTRILFEGPTGNLENLHCHVSTLKPGPATAARQYVRRRPSSCWKDRLKPWVGMLSIAL